MKILSLSVAALTLLLLCFGSRVNYTGYDSRGALLVSQALWETGSPRLDSYPDTVAALKYRVQEHGGHSYYYFPVGSSVCALPFVALARQFGMDMRDFDDDRQLQLVLAAIVCLAVFLLLYAIFLLRLPHPAALGLAVAVVLGSSLVSTITTAYWSVGPATACILGALYLHLRARRPGGTVHAPAIALLLFLACLCRPTMAAPSLLLSLWLWVEQPAQRLRFLLSMAFLALAFAVWSYAEFGSLLPAYYRPERVGGEIDWISLFGPWSSPSRGLLVFSPHLLAAALAFRGLRQGRADRRLVAFSLIWLGVHWGSVASFYPWWGGHSYGPRLMTEAVLPLALLTMEGFAATSWRRWPRSRRLVLGLSFAALTLFSFFVHVRKGLFEIATREWNRYPNISHHEERVLDWSDPQFLATDARVDDARVAMARARLRSLPLGATADPAGNRLVLKHWHRVARARDGHPYAWSLGERATVLFALREGEERANPGGPHELRLLLGAYRRQEVDLRLNGVPLGSVSHSGFAPGEFRLPIPDGLLRWLPPDADPQEATLNELVFLPRTTNDEQEDERRRRGVALWELEVDGR